MKRTLTKLPTALLLLLALTACTPDSDKPDTTDDKQTAESLINNFTQTDKTNTLDQNKPQFLREGVTRTEGLSQDEADAILVLDNFYLALLNKDFPHLVNTLSPNIPSGKQEVINFYESTMKTNNISIARFKIMTINLGSSADTDTSTSITFEVQVIQNFEGSGSTDFKDTVRIEKHPTTKEWGIVSIETTLNKLPE